MTYTQCIALTRMPMLLGVTQTFFVLSSVPCMVLFLITKQFILVGLLYVMLHGMGVLCCRIDERFFELMIGRWSLACPNRAFWGCVSYDPH